MELITRAIGAPLDRIDGPLKVTGAATYAYEYPVERATTGFIVQSPIAKGRILSIDASAARAIHGVIEVITYENAPKLHEVDNDISVLQSDAIAYHGEAVAIVVAETLDIAREAAAKLNVRYEQAAHDVELRFDRPDLYKPDKVNPSFPTDSEDGDPDGAFASATVTLEETYSTPAYHNNPMEPHATIAIWENGGVTLYDSNQGSHNIQPDIAKAFALAPERVRIIAPYVGGGFGSKAFTHPHQILAVMAAKITERPVKLALTRQQMFSLTGYRTPTIQRIRLGADDAGNLVAITHDVVELTSTVDEFAEQTALATRMMYASPNRRTTHRLAKLDLPVPSIMRAPGEAPGMFALESAMDEMAIACGLDPVEFRIRNEPEIDPDTKHPFSSRSLVACLREGAQRFGWERRDPKPRSQRDEGRLVGMGVAASTYPARRRDASANAKIDHAGNYRVEIDASDIGTGAWTVLTQIAADALDAPIERVTVDIGDTALPKAAGAGGSMGTSSWGSAIVAAAEKLRSLIAEHGGTIPPAGLEASAQIGQNPESDTYAMHAYGAQFAEVHVDPDTGEVRVPRLVGVFGVGRVMNPKLGRSQLLGGMSMGLSMALHEQSVIDLQFGHFANHDLAEYHIATNADIGDIDVSWVDEDDAHVNPMHAKGIGEIGIVGTAAAIANAVYHATGVRIRNLPIAPAKLL